MALYLGIDTSNYTTSSALYDSITKKVIQRKQLLPVKDGEKGLRQSDAVFYHNKLLPQELAELFKKQSQKLCAVGVSVKPRDIEGSYMPCFTVGEGYASALSSALDIPLHKFSHQRGHIAAALYSAKQLELLKEKYIAFHISGGTTEALLITPAKNLFSFNISIIGKTNDLSAGQIIDRVGAMLGLPFPSGTHIENLAKNCTNKLKPYNCAKNNNCNFSGLENKCKDLLGSASREALSLFVIESILITLDTMSQNIINNYGSLPLVYAGGVMSNNIIKKHFKSKYKAIFASPEFSSDNAAGTALLAFLKTEGL